MLQPQLGRFANRPQIASKCSVDGGGLPYEPWRCNIRLAVGLRPVWPSLLLAA